MGSPLQPDMAIQGLIDLVSNTTDAHATVLFLSPAPGEPLRVAAYQSLSRNIDLDVRIGPGEGLIGYVHKNNEAINVDQFDLDTRRLLFYRVDESIKSFMAVPLPKARGVLAVDSKQRYLFTEKGQKILHQYARAVETALENLDQAREARAWSDAAAMLRRLEGPLSQRPPAGPDFQTALMEIGAFLGTDLVMLAAVLPSDPGRYFLADYRSVSNIRLQTGPWPLERGLAGWVIREKKPLVLDKAHFGTGKSYILYPEEPLADLSGFSGYPLIWGGRLRGALLLAGGRGFGQDRSSVQVQEMAAVQLAAALEMDFLGRRVTELSRLDPQVGLPHRAYFVERLDRMIKRPGMVSAGLTLMLIRVERLDHLAREAGQAAAQEILRSVTRMLFNHASGQVELGHLSFGLFGVVLDGEAALKVKTIKDGLTEKLADHPLESVSGNAQLGIRTAVVKFPGQGRRAEELIYVGLTDLKT